MKHTGIAPVAPRVQLMAEKTESPNLVVRFSLYLALALMVWLKFRATHAVQAVVVVILFALVVLAVNYRCAVLVIGYLRSAKSHNLKLEARWPNIYVLVTGLTALLFCDGRIAVCVISIVQGISVSENSFGTAWLSETVGLIFTWAGAYELRIMNDTID